MRTLQKTSFRVLCEGSPQTRTGFTWHRATGRQDHKEEPRQSQGGPDPSRGTRSGPASSTGGRAPRKTSHGCTATEEVRPPRASATNTETCLGGPAQTSPGGRPGVALEVAPQVGPQVAAEAVEEGVTRRARGAGTGGRAGAVVVTPPAGAIQVVAGGKRDWRKTQVRHRKVPVAKIKSCTMS